MNKTRTVLHEENRNPPIVNLEIAHYGPDHGNYKVRTSKRGIETYFHLSAIECTAHDHKPRLREITEEFLAISTPESGAQFLTNHGPWKYNAVEELSGRSTVKWSELLITQAMITQLWNTHPSRWADVELRSLEEPEALLRSEVLGHIMYFDLNIDFGEYPPSLMVNSNGALVSLAADLVFTALSGLPSAFCARADCNRLFQKTTKHERKYCSTDCAHIESVRKHRARATRSK